MTNIDQFESVFKAADKTPFSPETVAIGTVLVITSLPEAGSQLFQDAAHRLLTAVDSASEIQWHSVFGEQYYDVDELLACESEVAPDLICTYRNLHSPAPNHPYSLGTYVDVLTQTTDVPVLLLPTPDKLASRSQPLAAAKSVMAITDHMTGNHHLVSYAARLTDPTGCLWLAHVEDERTYERYITAISKIPAIDTDTAQTSILEQLLKEPHEYIQSVQEVLRDKVPSFDIREIVQIGHHLTDYKKLISDHDIDLLVMNCKDDDQFAMHGLAYPLAVELRHTPLLML
jgi:hypothetical protein